MRPALACAGLLAGALVALSGNPAQAATTRYEAETSPAICTGTIDSDWAGWSGTNGSRCTSYDGALGWSFASDGKLVVTFGGSVVSP
ncbi:hypothetical protein [Streptomyces davaonensis]|uniref:hypothetical protein n=1 Tax=Streptomyces davaonensis TaxID=348043 RepID=UPI000A3055FF